MRLTYDPRYNIAYIRFHEKRTDVETVRISDELVVDMAPDGTIYGLELLNATQGAIIDQLDRLTKLHASGALSDEEFKVLKTRFIFQMNERRVGPFCSRCIDDYVDRA